MVDRLRRVVYVCIVFWLVLFEFSEQQEINLSTLREERIALLELRSSLGIRAKEWPIKENPCTDWLGISCSALDSRVIGINISRFSRTRKGSQNPQFSVDALQNLTALEAFNASNFALHGNIPDWFGLRLTSLQVLDLRSCGIIGIIPSTFGNLTNLTSVYLSDNSLSGSVPLSLGQLSRLSVLHLSNNSLTGDIPESFSSLGNLTWLDMSLNFLAGEIPPGVGKLSLLKILNLSGNSLSSSIPTQLGDLGNLVDLDLSENALVGPLPLVLGRLRSLQRMGIGGNSLSGVLQDNLFTSLTQLQFLVMDHANFSGKFPEILWSLPQLWFVDASGNNFTGSLPDVGPNVSFTGAIFNLSGNTFSGNLTTVIRRFSSIDLSANYLQGTVPDYASANVSLRSNCFDNIPNQRNQRECTLFYSGSNPVFDSSPAKSGKKNRNIILAAVLGGVALISLLVIFAVLLCVCIRKRGATEQRGTRGVQTPALASPQLPGVTLNFSGLGDVFTYQQILQATGEFSDENLIKHGHSGDLFKGILEGGIHVVIKRVDLQLAKKEGYMLELDIFSKVSSHLRLVPLLGHCLENDNEKFLVYKYMPNGDLSSSLLRKTNADDDSLQSLDWITRLKIAIGAAEGLSCLHHDCTPPLVHRDVQASSILLDDKFEVRLGSLSEVCAQEGDTHQRRITRLLRLPQTSEQGNSGAPSATCAYDVYCFGKILLELVTGKLGMSAANDATVKEWLDVTIPYINIYDKELVTNIVDPSLIIDEDLLEEVWAMAIVARSCLNPKPSKRPLMRYILKALENPLKVVREEHTSSARIRNTSSRGSWNAALFGSWRHSSSDVAVMPAAPTSKMEGGSSFKHSGTSASQGSGQIGEAGHSSSTRRQSKEIFPEPLDECDVEQQSPHKNRSD
ncbi:hypothetical protein Leryth_011584 [Lithospermum erythrorhizon]|nr:hypothetical protein Leryth_011584 [Lithospermum erythrorhizon]